MLLIATAVRGQITIGGNVYGGGEAGKVDGNGNVTIKSGTYMGNIYGGGNLGDLDGQTAVTLQGGDIQGSVFGGARMANVGKYSYVNVDGKSQLHDLTVNRVYGGNDVSGNVGGKLSGTKGQTEGLPFTPEVNNGTVFVDNLFQSFILATPERSVTTGNPAVTTQYHTFIGQMFGGGNGDYDYTTGDFEGLSAPTVAKSYMQVNGGTYGYVYAGGNAATVTGNAVISINNTSTVSTATSDLNLAGMSPITNINVDNPVDKRLLAMGINLSTFHTGHHFARVFGGNNKADMAIRPLWNLAKGSIHDLYSGGNEGRMTSSVGILLEIKESSEIEAVNVYGGCRKADVKPLDPSSGPGEEVLSSNIQLPESEYHFPPGFSARTLVRGGTITNVYGGNDISGKVYGGNAVGVYTSISGDVYGGGNGSYAYTDNTKLKNDVIWGDFYYNPGAESTNIVSLNAHRPNAEQVSLRLKGTKEKKTIIGGSVYVGGNSATLATDKSNPTVELKIGSYVIADNVFLGNNGENMVDTSENGVLARYASETTVAADQTTNNDFSQLDLTNPETFASYMDGCAMTIRPKVKFDGDDDTDVDTYENYTTFFGSFFGGGNVGSMITPGMITLNFNKEVIVFNKLVGGCNNADIAAHTGLNAAYYGGILGTETNYEENGKMKDRLTLNFNGVKLVPLRWKVKLPDSSPSVGDDLTGLGYCTMDEKGVVTMATGTAKSGVQYYKYVLDNGQPQLEYNVFSRKTGNALLGLNYNNDAVSAPITDDDRDRRLIGANVYGGCYNSGHVNGNVVINLGSTIHDRDRLFDTTDSPVDAKLYDYDSYNIIERHTGVLLNEQGMDVLGSALNVFGGGYGKESEIWGSATVNLNRGYTFQIFGGGEQGPVGKPDDSGTVTYDSKYSTYVNLKGSVAGVRRSDTGDTSDMAECEFIYGGGFEGTIAGDTHVNLGNGRIFNSFAGSCNADILGHTETYVGANGGFPWIRDHVYGGNDLGGSILGNADFSARIRNQEEDIDYLAFNPVKVTSYMEYTQGRVDHIFGGCYGNYDYTADVYKSRVASKPYLHNAFVNFRPNANDNNTVGKIFGAGEGYSGDRDGDKLQAHSYVLVDIPEGIQYFTNTEIFGAGAYNGLGMKALVAPGSSESELNEVSAIIDLMHGQVGAAYGGSYKEGVTRRSVVNVPEISSIKIGSIFGGAYGNDIYKPCDVYEANVNYLSQNEEACLIYDPDNNELMKGAIYGGNNAARRTLYGRININVPVQQKHYQYGMTTATVYGAGYGSNTWSEYTEINLNSGAKVWEVYGGGEAGGVMSAESVQKYIKLNPQNIADVEWKAAWTLGGGYDSESLSNYSGNKYTNLENPLARVAEIDDRTNVTDKNKNKYNTNVIIHKGAYVGNYAYGGGLGKEGDKFVGSGDIYGTTYIALLGGVVNKDIYAAGTLGKVYNIFGAENYTASTTAYIAGGTLRNVFGGGWKGDVGYTTMTISADGKTATFDDENENPGETHVVIGIREDQTDENLEREVKKVLGDGATKSDYGFYAGIPAIQRNSYGGGEGGAVFGSSNLTINNGYIGYVHLNAGETLDEKGKIVTSTESTQERYEAKIDDETYYDGSGSWAGKNRLRDSGNAFGGGYDVKSSVDFSHVTMWGGTVRNSLVGGGEIATIGRGAIEASGTNNVKRTLKGIYKAGKTNVELFNGHVLRNVYGGGKGYNIFGYGQLGTLYMDGYVFGQTEVHVHGGEVGTDEGLAEGYGNVFGGGDVGYVYSPSIYSDKTKARTGTGSPGHIYYYDTAGKLSEDCKVVISPYLQLKSNTTITYNGETYRQYDYLPTDYLNTLPKKYSSGQYLGGWENFFTGDTEGEAERGVFIHNAVFGGGNVSSNSEQTYANATTIYGNTTATLYDVYHRDFITVGTEHTGGIYGGGNLSVVDGYRELNITNYGTDYYGLKQTISIDEYRGLSNRERAYFQLEYKCTATSETNASGKTGITIDGVFYETDKRLTADEYLRLLTNESIAQKVKDSFEPYGFCSIYAGRLLNTIQRADLCGVYGSRMVLQGAKDRVAEVGEDINYTINRVGELSLNQQRSVIPGDTGENATHGNYFGIYSLVNYLGNLTSDVRFGSNYVNGNGVTESDKTYYSYKSANPTSNDRNKGQSFNQVALASGVFLELTTENSTADHKDYGYVTGVIELDLINVKKDLVGGGFVYAKNEHRVPMYYPNKSNVILSEYNMSKTTGGVALRDEARTYRHYRYSEDQEGDWSESEGATVVSGDVSHVYQTMAWQTSGNFIHPSKRIVDDCYPTNNAYIIGSANYSEAHYWYVKGEVYIYDQKVSAYTGSATAYSKEVHLPLTISAASNGKLQLLNVKPNLYAYKTDNNGTPVKIGSVGADGKPIDKVWVNNESDSYGLNDVISWWDWHQLSPNDRQYFVTETYVNCVACVVDGVEYEQGTYVMDQTDYDKFMAGSHDIRDTKGEHFKDDDNNDIGKTFVFRSSNNVSHETGYVLTFDMDSPQVWNDYFSPATGSSVDGKIMKTEYEAKFTEGMTDAQKQAIIEAWHEGPTFTPTETGVYGKRSYKAGEVITEATYVNAGEGKDMMEKAYVATESVTYTYNGITKTVNPGTAISETEYNGIGTFKNSFADAWYCTNSVKLTNEDFLLYGELKTADEIAEMKAIEGKLATNDEIDAALSPAYICTQDGEYGGQRFETGTNYSSIQSWNSLPTADREKFKYNYDALDLLVSSDYLVVDPNVTSSPTTEETMEAFHTPYADQIDVEYQAVFKKDGVDVIYNGNSLADGAVLTNKQFETIRNDKRHYTHVETKNNGDVAYIAKNNFIYLGTPYGIGQVVDGDVYNANRSDVEEVTFPTAGDWYYCYEDYEDENGSTVSKGKTINKAEYGMVPNYQQYFIIQGQEPTETTTLYVSSESNAYDVMKEKIVTVVYQYTYYEDEDDGSVKLTNELHVINIHLDLESGVPQIGSLSAPAIVLPGNVVGMKAPDVNPGLYEVIASGWELYTTQDDADNHRNGIPFENNNTPVYWYQNQKNFISFYSKTYLGKTYSNPVPLSVANYHDLDKVMQDKEHHMYVDKSNVERPCKIYIDNRDCLSDENKSELDLLKDFFDLSVTSDPSALNSELTGHALLDNHVRAASNLEFILGSDVSPKKYTAWTPIGNDDTTGAAGQCFSGNLHGDGHTVSGLSASLFGHLCGNVYNLGVTGSFTGAGVADTGDGYVANSWVKTVGTPAAGVKAVFGSPSASDGSVQVFNCYYPETNAYAAGAARKMPEKAFYNGEVAYSLNGYYLNKRYYDHNQTSSVVGTAPYEYRYLVDATDDEGNTTLEEKTAKYGEDYKRYVYVEDRYGDGDFRYAGGTIPETTDVRLRTEVEGEGDEAVTKIHFSPVWPDDYLFFGQVLNYGYVEGVAHQDTPSSINKIDGRLQTNAGGNRIYRAPAYFRNSVMQEAFYNPYAVFAQSKKGDASVLAYQNMTAIDFTGYNDVSNGYQKSAVSSGNTIGTTHFFPPLLDHDVLTGFQNVDLTRNLLVYSPQADTDNGAVLSAYLTEPEMAEKDDDASTDAKAAYRAVDALASDDIATIHGHLVYRNGNNFTASADHVLVDRQDFNSPIGYTFGSENRMWYQRTPDNYVDAKSGWEAVSLPFSAELVTTPDKGEITHFYSGSNTGHEYWLREFKGGTIDANDDKTYVASFAKPDAGTNRKDYTNTFLWDYYYSHDEYQDKNADQYQKTYYQDEHVYSNYAYSTSGTPYIIGFPGSRYYEFDLSGQFVPKRTLNDDISSLDAQTIIFASNTGASIGISDDELTPVTAGGYRFMPNYSNTTLSTAGTGYVLAADGGSFDRNEAGAVAGAFRPYFMKAPGGTRGGDVNRIVFGNSSSTDIFQNGVTLNGAGGTLNIYANKGTIVVESTLSYTTDVRIVTPAGITVSAFPVKSGETVVVEADLSGIYVAYTLDGKYTRKVSVDR